MKNLAYTEIGVVDRECARPALAISAVLRRLLRRARQHLFAPLIEALAGSFRGERGVGVEWSFGKIP